MLFGILLLLGAVVIAAIIIFVLFKFMGSPPEETPERPKPKSYPLPQPVRYASPAPEDTSREEKLLLPLFRQLDKNNQYRIIGQIEGLLMLEKYDEVDEDE